MGRNKYYKINEVLKVEIISARNKNELLKCTNVKEQYFPETKKAAEAAYFVNLNL